VSAALTKPEPLPFPLIWDHPGVLGVRTDRIRESRAVTGIRRDDFARNIVAAVAAAPALAGATATDVCAARPPYVRLVSQVTADPCLQKLVEDVAKPTAVSFAGYERYNQRNWDGYGADPITPETLRYARRLTLVLPGTFGRPDIAPSGDGAIGLEWVLDRGPLRKLFLDIGPGDVWRASWTLRSGEFGKVSGTGFTSATRDALDKLFAQLSGVTHVALGG
jgi:hypothetical protein